MAWPQSEYEIGDGVAAIFVKNLLDDEGWVSDQAVVDHQMDTLHIFTGVEIECTAAASQRLLRAIAQ